jgi:tRNA(Ile)-lysidine synthase
MIKKIQQFISDKHLIPAKTRTIFVAVSAGVDSCVLLHIMSLLNEKLGVRLGIVHFNHKTRAGESDRDQAFVADLAAAYGFPLHTGARETGRHNTSETALREARYSFFDKILTDYPQSLIATGHNRDDQIETFLMRLAMGSGLKGLLAIPASRDDYIRPLLPVSRSEILAYAVANKLAYREDKSNEDLTILRNRIRHQILPQWRLAVSEKIDTRILKVIANLAEYQKLYEDRLTEAVVSSVQCSGKRTTLQRRRYAAFKEPIRRGLIEYCISKHYHVNYKVTDSIFQIWEMFITKAQSGRRYEFLAGCQASAERDHIVFGEPAASRKTHIPLQLDSEVAIDEKSKISWIKTNPREVVIGSAATVEYVDADQCGDRLFVRFWRKGDRFQPLGMAHERKLIDFFIDLKLSIDRKMHVPLICNEELIVWVAGYRINENVKIRKRTKRVYKLELKNER